MTVIMPFYGEFGTMVLRHLPAVDAYPIKPPRQCTFIHIPKTAGSTIDSVMKKASVNYHQSLPMHIPLSSLSLADDVFAFTFVRNPWNRLASAYYYMMSGGNKAYDIEFRDKYMARYPSFRDFVMDLEFNYPILGFHHFIQQTHFLKPIGRIGFIGRFENLNSDLRSLIAMLGGKCPQVLPIIQKTPHPHYADLYDDGMKRVVTKVYASDINAFGYRFDSIDSSVCLPRHAGKIVCCQRGQECLFPSAHGFYYDWNNPVPDDLRGGDESKFKEKRDQYDAWMDRKLHQLYPGCETIRLDSPMIRHINIEPKRVLPVCDVVISARRRMFAPQRNWPHWRKLVDSLRGIGLKVGLCGDRDGSVHDLPVDALAWDHPQGPTAGTCDLLAGCRLYVGTDSGVSHLGAMMDVPMVLFRMNDSSPDRIGEMQARNKNLVIRLDDAAWTDPQLVIKAIFDLLRNGDGDEGVIYVSSTNRRELLTDSVMSLGKSNPGMPYRVVSDMRWPSGWIPANVESGYASRRDKIGMYARSPFERTVFIDDDTVMLGKIEPIYRVLDDCDMAMTIDKYPTIGQRADHQKISLHPGKMSIEEIDQTVAMVGRDFPHFSAGLIFFRRCQKVKEMFEQWKIEWEKYRGQDQFSLARAIFLTGIRVRPLDRTVYLAFPHEGLSSDAKIAHCTSDKLHWSRRTMRRLGLSAHGDSRGVVTSSDQDYFPGIQLLWKSIQECASGTPLYVADMGMTPEQCKWMTDSGIRHERFEWKRHVAGSGLHPRDAKLWLKPLIFATSPFLRSIFIDADAIVLRDLKSLFEQLEEGPIFTPDPCDVRNGQELFDREPTIAPRSNVSINSGVVGMHMIRDRDIVETWADMAQRAIADYSLRRLIKLHDQGLLNWCVHRFNLLNRVVDGRFNYIVPKHMRTVRSGPECLMQLRSQFQTMSIVHWAGSPKLWERPELPPVNSEAYKARLRLMESQCKVCPNFTGMTDESTTCTMGPGGAVTARVTASRINAGTMSRKHARSLAVDAACPLPEPKFAAWVIGGTNGN